MENDPNPILDNFIHYK